MVYCDDFIQEVSILCTEDPAEEKKHCSLVTENLCRKEGTKFTKLHLARLQTRTIDT